MGEDLSELPDEGSNRSALTTERHKKRRPVENSTGLLHAASQNTRSVPIRQFCISFSPPLTALEKLRRVTGPEKPWTIRNTPGALGQKSASGWVGHSHRAAGNKGGRCGVRAPTTRPRVRGCWS